MTILLFLNMIFYLGGSNREKFLWTNAIIHVILSLYKMVIFDVLQRVLHLELPLAWFVLEKNITRRMFLEKML